MQLLHYIYKKNEKRTEPTFNLFGLVGLVIFKADILHKATRIPTIFEVTDFVANARNKNHQEILKKSTHPHGPSRPGTV